MGSHLKTNSNCTHIRSAEGIHKQRSRIVQIINTVIIWLLVGFRPVLGPAACRHIPSCGNYAIKQLETNSTVSALWNICKQLISCNPFL